MAFRPRRHSYFAFCIQLMSFGPIACMCKDMSPKITPSNIPLAQNRAPVREGYHWTASLNRETGLASSTETSSFLLPSVRTTSSKSATFMIDRVSALWKGRHCERKIRSLSKDFVATWPAFLCKPSVTFGLFRTVRTSDPCSLLSSHKDTRSGKELPRPKPDSSESCVTTLQPRFLPCQLSVLNFGPAMARPFRQSTGLPASPSCNKNVLILGYWEIPLKGGLLALPSQHRQTLSVCEFGKLTFAIVKRRGSCNPNLSKNQVNHHLYEVTTHIVDYTPWLTGPPPVDWLRKQLYLHTQSYVHAYTMWRFHGEWEQKLKRNLL
jgi:hypothetical protein